jgi:hypothetical protein
VVVGKAPAVAQRPTDRNQVADSLGRHTLEVVVHSLLHLVVDRKGNQEVGQHPEDRKILVGQVGARTSAGANQARPILEAVVRVVHPNLVADRQVEDPVVQEAHQAERLHQMLEALRHQQ